VAQAKASRKRIFAWLRRSWRNENKLAKIKRYADSATLGEEEHRYKIEIIEGAARPEAHLQRGGAGRKPPRGVA